MVKLFIYLYIIANVSFANTLYSQTYEGIILPNNANKIQSDFIIVSKNCTDTIYKYKTYQAKYIELLDGHVEFSKHILINNNYYQLEAKNNIKFLNNKAYDNYCIIINCYIINNCTMLFINRKLYCDIINLKEEEIVNVNVDNNILFVNYKNYKGGTINQIKINLIDLQILK